MEERQMEIVGKVFVVVGSRRSCLICDGMFTPTRAAAHAKVPCGVVVQRFANKESC